MNKKILLVTLLIIMAGSTGFCQGLSLMTYNIRYATDSDGENSWENRKEFLTDQIRFYSPDIFGIQEGLKLQVDHLQAELTGYDFVGVGRDDGKEKGEYCAVYYKKDKFQLLGHDTFWLSDKPQKPSKGWDAAYERICTYAFFMDKDTGINFWVFNTHFDHVGVEARNRSVELIKNKVDELNKDNFPVFILGDFNLNEQSDAILYMSEHYKDSRQFTEERAFGPFGTFTGFEFHNAVQDRIDYIFCSKEGVRVRKYAVLTDSKHQKYPSDHFPVYVRVFLSR
ncbi:endonuclease/exonuclease/phosphatase family protein [Lutimonas saemankumensis]|uniref:endonuclease/exonuclease/phosphatase family protein n=1 Tax=Lutimonas saemankumensis TaxID=483016 RepID=UPI001CD27A6E|nr:endonuclease/exonuclease/phosphatase family protein [Lutimonas saemankumensis]MCA0932176.1 endonuclease/exonuclease/phosphatase family protein [Lutimonas saemankumensis]